MQVRKLLLIAICLAAAACFGCRPKPASPVLDSLLRQFYDRHSFEGDYTIEISYAVGDDDGDAQRMIFAKSGDSFVRTVSDQKGPLYRSFNKNHTLFIIDERTGTIERQFLSSTVDAGADLRNLFTERKRLTHQDPEVIRNGAQTEEIYRENGVVYRYVFEDKTLRSLTLEGGSEPIHIRILRIDKTADPALFELPNTP